MADTRKVREEVLVDLGRERLRGEALVVDRSMERKGLVDNVDDLRAAPAHQAPISVIDGVKGYSRSP